MFVYETISTVKALFEKARILELYNAKMNNKMSIYIKKLKPKASKSENTIEQLVRNYTEEYIENK